MARLPEGALMQRAAAGLAYAVLDLLGRGVRRPGAAARRRGQQRRRRAVRRRAARPARACGSRRCCSARTGPRRGARGPAARRRPGGRLGRRGRAARTSSSTGSSASAAAAACATTRRRWSRRSPAVPVVAVDTPSGRRRRHRAGSTARTCAPTVTVTFGTHKVAHLVDPAAMACGVVHLVDLGLDLPAPAVTALQEDDVRALLPRPAPDAHKYTRGVVGVRAGSEQYPGAGVLCVSGASAGLVGMVRYLGGAADLVRGAAPGGRGRRGPRAGLGDRLRRRRGRRAGPGRRRSADGVPVVVDADGLTHVDRPARRTRAAHPARRRAGPDARRRARAGRGRAAAVRPRGRPTVRRRGAAQGPAHAGRRTRPGRCGSPRSAPPGWPPPVPATCSPGCAGRCWRPGWTRSTPARSAPGCTARPRSSPATAARSPRPTSPPRCRRLLAVAVGRMSGDEPPADGRPRAEIVVDLDAIAANVATLRRGSATRR